MKLLYLFAHLLNALTEFFFGWLVRKAEVFPHSENGTTAFVVQVKTWSKTNGFVMDAHTFLVFASMYLHDVNDMLTTRNWRDLSFSMDDIEATIKKQYEGAQVVTNKSTVGNTAVVVPKWAHLQMAKSVSEAAHIAGMMVILQKLKTVVSEDQVPTTTLH